jgi:putative cell wall-binding protein
MSAREHSDRMPRRKDQKLSKERIKGSRNLDLTEDRLRRSRRYFKNEVKAAAERDMGKRAYRLAQEQKQQQKMKDRENENKAKLLTSYAKRIEMAEPGSKEEKQLMKSFERMKKGY